MGGISGLMRGGAYEGVLRWIIVNVLIAIGAAVLWDYGFLSYVFAVDSSRIAILIILVFAAYSVYCLTVLIRLGAEWRGLEAAAVTLEASTGLAPMPTAPLIATYLADITAKLQREPGGDRQLLLSTLANALRRPTRAGIYASDLLYKLGMLGTVIGFVIMLGSMDNLQSFEVDDLRDALQQMTGGMAIALLTTIAGLVCGILLRVQFNIADHLATSILSRAVRVTEVSLVPALSQAAAQATGGGDVRG